VVREKALLPMLIRPERSPHLPDIHAVNRAAFESPAEANLVDALRVQASDLISLVADDHGVVGHILFSPVTLVGAEALRAMALAPMAVHPDRQRTGIGSALVRAGLDECRRRGVEAVFVVGHAEYYPRFGFTRASQFGITCEFEVQDDVFVAIELVEDALRGKAGIVHFHEAFGAS